MLNDFSGVLYVKRIITLTAALFLTAGCNTIMPEPIQTDAQVNLVEFDQVNSVKGEYLSKQARWGGMIAKVINLEGKSVLEVVHFDLSDGGKPKVNRESKGRFKVYVDGFVDPLVYQQGKLITALGHIGEAEAGQIGEYEYQFPTLSDANVYLWKKTRPLEIAYYQPWSVGHSLYHSPYYFPRSYIRSGRLNRYYGTGKSNGPKQGKGQTDNGRTATYSSRKKPNG
jgi:outer membrane lipoprotein